MRPVPFAAVIARTRGERPQSVKPMSHTPSFHHTDNTRFFGIDLSTKQCITLNTLTITAQFNRAWIMIWAIYSIIPVTNRLVNVQLI